MRKSLRRKIVSGLVMGSMVLAMGTMAFAADSTDTLPPMPQQMGQGGPGGPGGGPGGDFAKMADNALTRLVDQGTITASQKEELVAFFKAKDDERRAEMKTKQDKQHHDMLKEIQDAAGLSGDQAKAVDDALRPPMPPQGTPGQQPPAPPQAQ